MLAISTEPFTDLVSISATQKKRSTSTFFQQIKVDFRKAIAAQERRAIASQRNMLLLGFHHQPNLRVTVKEEI